MSKLATKISAVGLSIITMVTLSAPVASAQSTADLQSQIASLLAQISALQAQLNAGATTGGVAASSFTRNLTVGSRGTDVTSLQQILMNAGYLKIAAPTAYFGPATKAALAAWQKDKGISPAVGYFGPVTRAAMGGASTVPGTGPVVVPVGTDLQVSLASDSPSARTIGSGTAFNPALKLNLSAGSKAVNISSLKFMKGGFLATTNLNGVEVVDTLGNRYGNVITSVNADNSILITFGTNPISIAAGAMKQIVVRFNLVRGAFTGTISFSLDSVSSIVADTTAISGAFPIVGSIMNIVDGSSSLASTTLDVLALSSSTLNVDEMSEQDMTKFRIREVSSNEAIKLYKLVLYNYGSTGDADFKDVQLVDQTGTVLATAQPMNKWISFDLSAAPFLIDKGLTKDFTVRAKLVSGSNRTVRLVVYNNYDVISAAFRRASPSFRPQGRTTRRSRSVTSQTCRRSALAPSPSTGTHHRLQQRWFRALQTSSSRNTT